MVVFDGSFIFRLRDEKGVPLSIIFDYIEKHGYSVDWFSYVEAACKVWKIEKVLSDFEGSMKDVGLADEYVEDFLNLVKLSFIRIYS